MYVLSMYSILSVKLASNFKLIDEKLQVIFCLYALSALGRLAFGITIAYAGWYLSILPL